MKFLKKFQPYPKICVTLTEDTLTITHENNQSVRYSINHAIINAAGLMNPTALKQCLVQGAQELKYNSSLMTLYCPLLSQVAADRVPLFIMQLALCYAGAGFTLAHCYATEPSSVSQEDLCTYLQPSSTQRLGPWLYTTTALLVITCLYFCGTYYHRKIAYQELVTKQTTLTSLVQKQKKTLATHHATQNHNRTHQARMWCPELLSLLSTTMPYAAYLTTAHCSKTSSTLEGAASSEREVQALVSNLHAKTPTRLTSIRQNPSQSDYPILFTISVGT